MREKIVIVDDEKSLLDLLSRVFTNEGYQVQVTTSAARAIEIIEKEDLDVLIADIRLPETSGMEILKRCQQARPDVPVIIITAYGNMKQAIEALKMGALDYIIKPFDLEELKITVAKGLEKRRLEQENILLKREIKGRYSFENMIGKSRAMQEIFTLIEKIARTDSTVLITGESGTGKEMAARAIHFLSRRADQPFVSINCAALPENLLESELFGHVKGAFTDAVNDKRGMFEVAQRGTLLLDEVGEMSPWTQVKLLRALQERSIRRVGGTEEIPVDVRIIAATNQDLKKRIKEGKFRKELYYRLNVISFEMPPLKRRIEDIPLLVQYFLQKYCQQMGKRMKRVSPEAMSLLEMYSWPGNVRELENVIERVVAIEDRETITPVSLSPEITRPTKQDETQVVFNPGFNLMGYLDDIAKKYMRQAMMATNWNMKQAASLLGLSYRSMRYLMDKYKIKEEGERQRL